MHWLTQPGTSHRRGSPHHHAGQQGAQADPGSAQLRRPHRPGFDRRRGGRRLLRRELDQRRSRGRLRRDARLRSRKWSTAIPDSYRDVQTYLKERIREVLTGTGDGDRRPHLRPRPRRPARQGRRGQDASWPALTGASTRTVELQVEIPQIKVEVNLDAANRYGLKPGDVRRAAATLIAGEEVGDIYRDGKAYDVQVWSTPETRHQPHEHREPPDRHARRADRSGWPMSPTIAVKPTPNVIERTRRIPPHRCRRQREGSRSRLRSPTTSKTQPRARRLPARLPRGAARRIRRAPGRPATAAALRDRARRSASSCCCRRRSELAAGHRSPS